MQHSPEKIWKTLIVDDEEAARSHLARLLDAHPNVRVVATAGTVEEAARLFRSEQPELVFLDIEMRGSSGFDLLPHLDPVPRIIFVTAHPDFAVKAFEVNAVDYILKPVFAGRLDLALNRILQPEPAAGETVLQPFNQDDLLFLRSPRSSITLAAREIVHITAAGNFSHVVASKERKIMIYRTLGQWEERLPAGMFQRVDRSVMINVSRLEKINIVDRNTGEIRLRGTDKPLQIGRTALHRLQKSLPRS